MGLSWTSARHSNSLPSDDVRYLDLATAAMLVEAARDVAEEIGRPIRVPPVRLWDCDTPIIESALAAPSASFGGHEPYPDMASKAAVLLYGLAKSQACFDGNKRLACICVLAFLRLNGWELAVGNTELATRIKDVGASVSTERDAVLAGLTDWVEAAIRRRLFP